VNPHHDIPQVTADGPIDGHDLEVLASMADVFARIEPVPAGLVDRIRFAVALEHLDAEVARIRAEHAPDLALARGDEATRTITFESPSLTIMITISAASGDMIRLDGWLAPPAAHPIELRTATGEIRSRADDEGCFAFRRVPRGLAQLVVRTDGDPSGRAVVTPSIVV
jgi:hypothetical protein